MAGFSLSLMKERGKEDTNHSVVWSSFGSDYES